MAEESTTPGRRGPCQGPVEISAVQGPSSGDSHMHMGAARGAHPDMAQYSGPGRAAREDTEAVLQKANGPNASQPAAAEPAKKAKAEPQAPQPKEPPAADASASEPKSPPDSPAGTG